MTITFKRRIGDTERTTQNRVIDILLSKEMGYKYLGFWQDRENNSNIEREPLANFLKSQGYSDELIRKAINKLEDTAKLGIGNDSDDKLYNANKEFYSLLRYGESFKIDSSSVSKRVHYINWDDITKNDFYIAEEVTYKGNHEKRPDIVIYVNGIALAVIELKSGRVDVAEAIRQNITNQRREITQFFTTVQFVIAGNESQGLRYGTTLTPEKYYLQWKEYNYETKEAIRIGFFDEIKALLNKKRFLEIIHDFIVFDCGIKKLCRQNQYFGVKCAQKRIQDNKDGIVWHTQGSGKSLTMVWLAKWYKEFYSDGRVLVITDRVELDEQIEGVFAGVGETIVRTKSGSELLKLLDPRLDDKKDKPLPRLICSLVHKFGCATKSEAKATDEFIENLRKTISKDFSPQGKILVFVDECHRTQSGKLHEAMKEILPNAIFIGFTGTPLLKENKESIKTFGTYIHTYKFKEAVEDKVVLDLRYEPRDVPQYITQQDKIDEWFELKTRGLNETAKTKLKKQWANLQVVSSSHSRLEKIANDIIFDFGIKSRLESGKGNAILVAGSIYEACKFWEIFQAKNFKKCAVITSYSPSHKDIRTEDTGEETPSQTMEKYDIYLKMLGIDETTPNKDKVAEEYEKETKNKFKKEPNNLKLLIVVDKLLTGFDAPSATYLYIDKKMQDHALFQAVCRVNRLDGDSKDYGYIVDYKDLFEALEKSVQDYTSNAFANFDEEDIVGLLKDRKSEARIDLDKAIETIDNICEDVNEPKSDDDYRAFFGCQFGDDDEFYNKKRLNMYKAINRLIRAYANFKGDMLDVEYGYSTEMAKRIDEKVANYTRLKELIALSSGDYLDLKAYESDMRTLIDNYIEAGNAHKLVDFDGMSLIEVVIGEDADEKINEIESKFGEKAVAETIANHIRRVVNYEYSSNPEYYKKMSELLTKIIEEQRHNRIKYKEYLQQITELARQIKSGGGNYPESIKVKSLRALYDNLGENEKLAIKLDSELRVGIPAGYQNNPMKIKKVKQIIQKTLHCDDETTKRIYTIVAENY